MENMSQYLFYHIEKVTFMLQTISPSLKVKFRLVQLNKLDSYPRG